MSAVTTPSRSKDLSFFRSALSCTIRPLATAEQGVWGPTPYKRRAATTSTLPPRSSSLRSASKSPPRGSRGAAPVDGREACDLVLASMGLWGPGATRTQRGHPPRAAWGPSLSAPRTRPPPSTAHTDRGPKAQPRRRAAPRLQAEAHRHGARAAAWAHPSASLLCPRKPHFASQQEKHSKSPFGLNRSGFWCLLSTELTSSSSDFSLSHHPALGAGDPAQLRPQANTLGDAPGSWGLDSRSGRSLSWRDGALGGRPGPGYRAAGAGPEVSAKPSAAPGSP